jgi:hypothetical protein
VRRASMTETASQPDVTPLQPETGFSSSRDRMRSHRARKKYGLVPRRLLVSRSQLDQLEERGYLDPGLRGNPADEVEAVQELLADVIGP